MLTAVVGRWGVPSAPINWCELDYSISFYVAELFNTVTNAGYVIAGLIALARCSRLQLSFSSWFLSAALIMTGLTSALFHATLWRMGQKLDEAFENMTIIALLYIQKERPAPTHVVAWTVAHSVVASVLIFLISHTFCELHLVCVIALVLHKFKDIGYKSADAGLLLKAAAIQGVLGFACWAIDRVACEILQHGPLPFNPQLHSFWHLLTALALYNATVLAAWWEVEGSKGAPRLSTRAGGMVGWLEPVGGRGGEDGSRTKRQ